MDKKFTSKDLARIERHGLTVGKIMEQIDRFRSGFDYLPVESAATVGNGIVSLNGNLCGRYADRYSYAARKLSVLKFVPASGAATRMFKECFEYLESGKPTSGVEKMSADREKLAFYEFIADKTETESLVRAITEYGASLPKALVLFHKYPEGARTAMEEHLAEGAMYAAVDGKVKIHFTVSAEHEAGFRKKLTEKLDFFESRFGVVYDASFSQQKSSTDTIAVTPDNEPFRDGDGSLLFRPAGHGALLENLNDLDADIIFIKNVDNVTADHFKEDTAAWKKAIAGVLLDLQEKVFGFLEALDRGNDAAAQIEGFMRGEMFYKFPENYPGMDAAAKNDFLRRKLDRPIRVCGMVANTGEPGGGPFFVRDGNGGVSLQIAESAQISPRQKHLMNDGTHFNPVDLCCGVRDYRGRKFDLLKYSDPATGFISEKTKDGRKLMAQELPGLWNGAMADWNTVFVEVPASTFTPVKEAADLLKPEHQQPL